MDIIVCMKPVPDLAQIRIQRETRVPILDGAPLVFGPFEKNALEEAVRLRDKCGGKVIAVALGASKLKELILEALAIGADEAFLLQSPEFAGIDSAGTAFALAAAIRQIGKYDLILTGEGSADNYSGQVTSRLAELLDLPQITYVRELQVTGKSVRATRDLEQALQVVEGDLPLVVSVTSEINTPRLPPLTAILKAARKPIKLITAADLGIGAPPRFVRTLSNLAPLQDRKHVLLEGDIDKAVDALVCALDKERAR